MIDEEALKSIENLHRLKGEGIITEEEFESSKQRILFGQGPRRATPSPSLPGLPKFTGDLPAKNDHLAWSTLPLRRYADFEGRSGRREFWMFLLFTNAVVLLLGTFMVTDIDQYGESGPWGKAMLALLVIGILAAIVPLLAVEVRRLHDQDRSGWFALLNLIPYVGFVAVLVMMLLPGTTGPNRFGAEPVAG